MRFYNFGYFLRKANMQCNIIDLFLTNKFIQHNVCIRQKKDYTHNLIANSTPGLG